MLFNVCNTTSPGPRISFDSSHCQHSQGSVQKYAHINTFMYTVRLEGADRPVILTRKKITKLANVTKYPPVLHFSKNTVPHLVRIYV